MTRNQRYMIETAVWMWGALILAFTHSGWWFVLVAYAAATNLATKRELRADE